MILLNPAAFDRRPCCVLLDLDNTLYEYAPCHTAGHAAAAALAHQLLNLSRADFDRCFAQARTEIKARLTGTGSSHSRLLYFQRTMELAGFASQAFAALQLEQTFWRAYLDAAVLHDHAHAFLDDLRIAGIPTVLVTDLTAQIQLRKLVVLGLDRLIDWIVTSEESGHDKPHPASFELALTKLGAVGRPIWMIGDDVEADLEGARRAIGAVTLHKVASAKELARSAGVDACFDSFTDLSKVLGRLP